MSSLEKQLQNQFSLHLVFKSNFSLLLQLSLQTTIPVSDSAILLSLVKSINSRTLYCFICERFFFIKTKSIDISHSKKAKKTHTLVPHTAEGLEYRMIITNAMTKWMMYQTYLATKLIFVLLFKSLFQFRKCESVLGIIIKSGLFIFLFLSSLFQMNRANQSFKLWHKTQFKCNGLFYWSRRVFQTFDIYWHFLSRTVFEIFDFKVYRV